ncbi:MAG TPA: metallophosphoesterase [Pyrinomonadaceae bacterium]|jgi:predicted MPP superfamily phosphohydrolase|nr:metallophosphoesterase [Pyrinomonadaceae bacterium]
MPERRKTIIRIALLAVFLLIVSTGVWSFLIEPNRLVVRQQTIEIKSWPQELSGLRIALISDIHAGGPFIDEKKLQQIVATTNALNPDLILLLGDYMSQKTWHAHEVAPEVIAANLKQLRAPLGVYGVLGNHDWWYNGEKVRRAFAAEGIRILEDQVVEVKWRQGAFWLVGLADKWTRPQHIDETVAKVPSGSTMIALTHNPDIFPKLPKAVPLLLAGHTHGGQVNLPLIGPPVTPSDYGQRYAAGHIFENDHHLFVTSGIGTSILPVRFRVPPEIVILTLNSG